MNEHARIHARISDLLPLYVSGALDPDQRAAVENHLAGCAECRADLALWKAVSGEIAAGGQAVTAPRGLAERALAQAEMHHTAGAEGSSLTTRPSSLIIQMKRFAQLLHSQMSLVHREIWLASALVIGLGYIAALISAHSAFMYALAPLVAAGCVSLIYGPENDPAFELALATPTSPRQILLARLVLVFGYNLALVLAATLALLPVLAGQPQPLLQQMQPLFGTLVLSWLAPMTFLSAAALALSLWIGAPNAVTITYIIWLAELLSGPLRSPQAGLKLSPAVVEILAAYQTFWQNTALLLALSAVLLAAAIWMVGKNVNSILGDLRENLSRRLSL